MEVPLYSCYNHIEARKYSHRLLNLNKSFISKAKMQAIQRGLMDIKQTPTAEGMEYLEWVKTQYDIMAYVKKVNQFAENSP
jgi:hypothetical protein